MAGVDDELVTVRPVLERWPRFASLLADGGEEGFAALRQAEGSGRPTSSPIWNEFWAAASPGARQAASLARPWANSRTCCYRYRVDVLPSPYNLGPGIRRDERGLGAGKRY